MGRQPFAFALLFAALLCGASFGAFEERSLLITISFNQDGSAHVEENLVLFISGQQSIDLYESSAVFNDLSSWRTRTGIEDLQNHITRAVVSFESFRIRPQPVERCNLLAETCFGSIVWEYDVAPIQPNQTGILKLINYKPRTTSYALNSDALNFPRSKTGDILLSRGTTLRLEMPADSSRIFFSKIPSNLNDAVNSFKFDPKNNRRYYSGPLRIFEWAGETLPQFEVSFEREEPLEKEIIDFFNTLQSSIFNLLRSQDGASLLLLGMVFVASALSLHSISKVRA